MVDFISNNPAMEAYQRGQKLAAEAAQADASLEGQTLANKENRLAMPSRLRTVGANADLAVTRADTAQQTAPYEVTVAREGAARAPIQTEQARFGLEQEKVQAPMRNEMLRTQVSTAGLQNIAAQVDGFYKSLELANSGDMAGARYVAGQYGQQIPENVLTNAALRAQITVLAGEAKARYPTNPKKQQEYLALAMKGLSDATLGEGNAVDPMYPYQVPGAPEPDASSGANIGGVFEVKRQAWLAAYPGDEQGALAFASGTKQQSDADLYNIASNVMAREFAGQFGVSPEQKQQRVNELFQQLKGMQGSAMPTPVPQPGMPQPGAPGAVPPEDDPLGLFQ